MVIMLISLCSSFANEIQGLEKKNKEIIQNNPFENNPIFYKLPTENSTIFIVNESNFFSSIDIPNTNLLDVIIERICFMHLLAKQERDFGIVIILKRAFETFDIFSCKEKNLQFHSIMSISLPLFERLKKTNSLENFFINQFNFSHISQSNIIQNQIPETQKIDFYSRNLQIYADNFYNLALSYSGCVPCAIMNFTDYIYLTTSDYSQILTNLTNYKISTYKNDTYEYSSICNFEEILRAGNKLMEQTNFVLRAELCDRIIKNDLNVNIVLKIIQLFIQDLGAGFQGLFQKVASLYRIFSGG